MSHNVCLWLCVIKLDLFCFRRSKDAGDKLKDGNLSIADLNDPNRPTKLAEMFLQLYDNEWTDALEILTKDEVPERQAIETLLGYLEVRMKLFYFGYVLLHIPIHGGLVV